MAVSNKNEHVDNRRYDVWATMLGSASAGMIARSFCHPLDTVKSRLQASVSKNELGQVVYRRTMDVMKQTFKQEGLRGLYRGFLVAFLGSAPAACLYLTSYEESKKMLLGYEYLTNHSFFAHFGAGIMAETISCVFWVPIDVIKERLQIQHTKKHTALSETSIYYRNTGDAVRKILRHEGIRGVYKGYGATLLSFGPFSALYFLFYEKGKNVTHGILGTKNVDEIPFSLLMLNSAGAGCLASFLTNPLDLVKLRLQVQRGQPVAPSTRQQAALIYTGILDGLVKIVRHEGFRGLFRGAGARMAFHAPSTAITMASFERCKIFFQHAFGTI